jgi:mRNA interferase HigB
MRVISKRPIREFWECHTESKLVLEDWFHKVSRLTGDFSQSIKIKNAIRCVIGCAEVRGVSIANDAPRTSAHPMALVNILTCV